VFLVMSPEQASTCIIREKSLEPAVSILFRSAIQTIQGLLIDDFVQILDSYCFCYRNPDNLRI
jgi:hypothetical protein